MWKEIKYRTRKQNSNDLNNILFLQGTLFPVLYNGWNKSSLQGSLPQKVTGKFLIHHMSSVVRSYVAQFA